MLTLITPTGDRPEAFQLCEYWMGRQTYKGDIQWIVVDDGVKETCCTRNQEYVRRVPRSSDPSHTLGVNLLEAIPRVKGSKVIIIEDDDYYDPCYLETMSRWLDSAELVGERGAKYYYLASRAYYFWTNHQHASLCRTGFSASAVDQFRNTIEQGKRGNPSIDMAFWERFTGKRQLHETLLNGKAMCVGIKQLPGRTGITHRRYKQAVDDPDMDLLRVWTGDDFAAYRRFVRRSDSFIPYTVCFGGYDTLGDPPSENSHVICDRETVVPEGWHEIRVERTQKTPRLESRLWKMRPDLVFPHDNTLYFDGSIQFKRHPSQVVQHLQRHGASAECVFFRHDSSRSIKEEIAEIVRLRFADESQVSTRLTRENEDLPVALGGLIFRRPTPSAKEFGEVWWRLFSEQLYNRDQVILPIALKESGAMHTFVDTPISEFVTIRPHAKRREKL